ncbi:hypothetical protein JOY44_29110 [Phormidium sp. CLA17]|uniref:hypothetical protein n=1 Tax=Leptolyngbya sp. Cla-17 TaxID=2803751 RepID=UPI00149277E0|nr:hypothetical protein [Leptolyngbya sp. Cla-17]MBM0740257.1 hypothetical protein [Leptolyngbya sp. Cla-17]MBM0740354.1 hypothetical protein [Leptolyngbya sp. Cla-17]MBM0741314.1 hypothetical protein [Leptolyngbya sp. Cla-17]MBM0742149.1 hypothetical protein [Leptolyngbya sp. Cla-17]MBM0742622.1 hypothetical protein [Leptolyngbya sp. Cla-17]
MNWFRGRIGTSANQPEQETDRTRPWDTHLCISPTARQHAKQDQLTTWRVNQLNPNQGEA